MQVKGDCMAEANCYELTCEDMRKDNYKCICSIEYEYERLNENSELVANEFSMKFSIINSKV